MAIDALSPITTTMLLLLIIKMATEMISFITYLYYIKDTLRVLHDANLTSTLFQQV